MMLYENNAINIILLLLLLLLYTAKETRVETIYYLHRAFIYTG